MKIAFVGTGIMGSRMAANLIANGYDLTVHNRSKDKATNLIEQGAQWADTPAQAVTDADVVFTMLAHPPAVESVAAQFLDSMQKDAIWVDSSTVNPQFARQMAAKASEHGINFLDAPVGGSKKPAQDGNLVFFVGGDATIVEKCRPLFDVMGKAVNHVGEHGMGNALKLVINYLLGTSMLAFAEGLAFGESMGLSQETLLNTLVGSKVTAPFLAAKRHNIENNNYDVAFPLRWLQKDLQMAAETAYEAGAPMPIANIAKELYQFAIQHGHGDDDFSAIYAFIKG